MSHKCSMVTVNIIMANIVELDFAHSKNLVLVNIFRFVVQTLKRKQKIYIYFLELSIEQSKLFSSVSMRAVFCWFFASQQKIKRKKRKITRSIKYKVDVWNISSISFIEPYRFSRLAPNTRQCKKINWFKVLLKSLSCIVC